MREEIALEIAQSAITQARDAGAESAEATVTVARRFHAEARETVVAKLEQTTAKSLHVRVFLGGRKASLSTTDLTGDGLRAALARTIAGAAFVAPDPFAGLPDEFASAAPALHLCDPRVEQREPAEKVEEALALERTTRAYDSRIVNSSGSHYNDSVSVTAIANTAGFAAAYASTRAGRSTAPVAVEAHVKRTAHYGTAARRLDELESTEAVARKAGRRAVELFGARKPATMRVPVIFERDVAAGILDDLFAATSAANVATGNSWLVGKVGERIGSEFLNVVDDGRLDGRIGSAPFDGEGVSTRRTPVFENGRLLTFLYDTYYARKLGAASTGNSNGGGIGANSFFLQPGEPSLEDLVAGTRRGVLVLDTIGFAHEHASGTYSRGARGFFIRDGELAYPIDEFTIAGAYADILAGIDGVADDLVFDGSVVSPSFRVAEMTISGA